VKRVTLLVQDVEVQPGRGWRLAFSGEPTEVLYLHARHILAIEDADGRDFAPLDPAAPPAAPRVLAVDERVAPRVGAVVRELENAVLVTGAPIQPAPVATLPTELGEKDPEVTA
jgi:hypothetical protein